MTLHDLVDDYHVSTSIFLHSLAAVSDENLDRHVAGGWSAR